MCRKCVSGTYHCGRIPKGVLVSFFWYWVPNGLEGTVIDLEDHWHWKTGERPTGRQGVSRFGYPVIIHHLKQQQFHWNSRIAHVMSYDFIVMMCLIGFDVKFWGRLLHRVFMKHSQINFGFIPGSTLVPFEGCRGCQCKAWEPRICWGCCPFLSLFSLSLSFYIIYLHSVYQIRLVSYRKWKVSQVSLWYVSRYEKHLAFQ
jgi:hypothetical protein